jgi:hypothetical protein
MTRFDIKAKTTAAIVKKGIALMVVATTVSGCMGNMAPMGGAGGAGAQQNFQPVQEKQFSDATKACRDIQAEVAQLDRQINGIQRKIQGARTTQSALGFLSSFGSLNANQQSLASFGQSQTNNETYRLEDVKRSYQTRRDALFRGFVNKGCKVS